MTLSPIAPVIDVISVPTVAAAAMDMSDLYEDDVRPWNLERQFDLLDGQRLNPALDFADPAEVDGAHQMASNLRATVDDDYASEFSGSLEDHGIVENDFLEYEPVYAVSDVVDPENPNDIAAMQSVVGEVEPHVPRSTLFDFSEGALFDEFADSDSEGKYHG